MEPGLECCLLQKGQHTKLVPALLAVRHTCSCAAISSNILLSWELDAECCLLQKGQHTKVMPAEPGLLAEQHTV